MAEFPIIEKLGGRDAVFTKLQADVSGKQTTADALRMWTARRAIPGDAVVRLMKIAESDGVEYTAQDFILPPPSENSIDEAAA